MIHLSVVEGEDAIGSYGINAICTHLGFVVPWNRGANKFMCPCHGNRYDATGKVVRGPAPSSLALASVSVENDNVFVSQWTERFPHGRQALVGLIHPSIAAPHRLFMRRHLTFRRFDGAGPPC